MEAIDLGGTSSGRRGAILATVLSFCACCIGLGALVAPAAGARSIYVASRIGGSVSVIDGATNQVLGTPIKVGESAREIAITPDGSRAYVTNRNSKDIYVIDTHTNQVVGAPIKFADDPIAIAITPDGTRAYVAQLNSKIILVVDTRTNQVVGQPIEVGSLPRGIAITPDGARAYVVNKGSNNVSVIDTRTNQVIGQPIEVGVGPRNVAITPDGSRAYVTSNGGNGVSVIDTRTNLVIGEPISVGAIPSGIAITPDGGHAYVANELSGTVSVIDTHTNTVVGAPIQVGEDPRNIAITPDGTRAYVANESPSNVSVIDTRTNQVVGAPIPVGEAPFGVAISPDQPPLASFKPPVRARPGVPVRFDAAASTDPDGTLATYGWDFGDHAVAALTAPLASHSYARPGAYQVTLSLTDNEGCSTSLLFTGQTAFCNGQASARITQTVNVAYPGARIACPKRARRGGCAFKLQVIAKRPRSGRKAKAESAVARARVKPGHAAIVSLKPKKAFQAKLARAKSVLVMLTAKIGSTRTTRIRRLKIVR